ncbi:MAG: formylglycine-generating enzyme family protein [Thermoanaerobaculia bacterium]
MPRLRHGAPICLLASLLLACQARPERWTEPSSGIVFLRVPAGTLTMGSPASEPSREAQEVEHLVHLSRAFFLSATEVTQGQWQRVMGENPAFFAGCGGDCPVENVTFRDVSAFLARLGARVPDERFRLPTEAEWEYACRAGSRTPFSTGDRLSTDQANYDGRYPMPGSPAGVFRGRPIPVAELGANPWGFSDLHGNVWEWTADDHCPYPSGPVLDPLARCASGKKVIRGGSWAFGADSARCALRYTHAPEDRGYSLGFRLVREVPGTARRP